jgi:Uma2 family endonuclease
MAMPATRWTADMVRALPDDGKRYEVIDGELFVTPAPTWSHQRAAGAFFRLIAPYVSEHSIGDTLIAPADVLTSEHVMVEPDVFVVPLAQGRKPASWEEARRLLLVIEILRAMATRRSATRDPR